MKKEACGNPQILRLFICPRHSQGWWQVRARLTQLCSDLHHACLSLGKADAHYYISATALLQKLRMTPTDEQLHCRSKLIRWPNKLEFYLEVDIM